MTVSRTRHRLGDFVRRMAGGCGGRGWTGHAGSRQGALQPGVVSKPVGAQSSSADGLPTESSEIASYQVFCLLALGRKDDAKRAIAALVRADPLYRPSEASTSPRMRAAFDEVRRNLLPGIVQRCTTKLRRRSIAEPQTAATEFDRVLALLDEPELADASNMPDLRRLATGFRDLSRAAAGPPAPVAAIAKAPDLPALAPAPAAASRRRRSQPPTVPATRASSCRWLCRARRPPPGSHATRSRSARSFGSSPRPGRRTGDVTSAVLGRACTHL
jgi:hypothetical protein